MTGLALAGCSDSGEDTGGPADNDASAAGDGEAVSPLLEFLGGSLKGGAGVAMGDEEREQLEQEQRQIEELVVACMQEAGFEYVPPPEPVGSEFADAQSMDPDEFAKQYGYGISTMSLEHSVADQPLDPNQVIRDGLSAAAQEAYDKALSGVAIGTDVEGGCENEAPREVRGAPNENASPDLSAFQGLFEDIGALRTRISNDPRTVAAEDAWVECMAAAGHPGFDVVAEAQTAVMDRWVALEEDAAGSGSASDEAGPISPGDIDEADFQEMKEYERDVAVADHECQQDGYAEIRQDITIDLETQFVEEHRQELEQYRDVLVEAGGGLR